MELNDLNNNQCIELILKVKTGERTALNEFYFYVNKFCKNIIVKKVFAISNENRCALSHEITTKIILEKVSKYDLRKPFSPWLYKVVCNSIIDDFRQYKRKPITANFADMKYTDFVEMIDITSDLDTIQEKENLVHNALSILPLKKKELIFEYYFVNKSIKTIAFERGRSIHAVSSEIHSTRQILKRILQVKGLCQKKMLI